MKNCSICHLNFESEEPAVLTMSGFGNPRHICPSCEKDLDEATLSKEPEVISAAIERIGKKMQNANNDDKLILDVVSGIIESATERGEMIKNGVYDFENDEAQEDADAPEEVPEELLETEEDKERDRREKKANEKLDKFMNWVLWGVLVGFIGYTVYWIISRFF